MVKMGKLEDLISLIFDYGVIEPFVMSTNISKFIYEFQHRNNLVS